MSSRFTIPRRGGVKAASSVIQPYVDEAREKSDRRKKWLQPVEYLFDLLSRGQYMASNLGEDVGRRLSGESDVQLWRGLLEGLTGERKGTWEHTLFGGQDVGEEGSYEGWFPNNPEWMERKRKIPLIGPTSMEDVIGFVADVVVDPINLISFGSTKAAKAAAQEFAERAVAKTAKNLSKLPEVAKLTRKGLDIKKLDALSAKSSKAAGDYLAKFASKSDVSRIYERVFKEAKKEALSGKLTPAKAAGRFGTPKADLVHRSAQELAEEGREAATKNLFAAPKGLDDLVKAYETTLLHPSQSLPTATESYKKVFSAIGEYADDPDLAKEFAKMGERSWRFLGKERFKSIRQPNVVSRGWQTVVDGLAKTKPGAAFSDAWWSLLNNPDSMVALLRKKFGFRNPYQALLRGKEQNLRYGFKFLADEQTQAVQGVLEGVDDATRQKVVQVLGEAAQQKIEIDEFFKTPGLISKFGMDEKTVNEVREVALNVGKLTDEWLKLEQELSGEGLLAVFKKLNSYLPTVGQTKNPLLARPGTPLGSFKEGFTQHKFVDLVDTEAQEAAKFKWLLGVDEETAVKLVTENNLSSFSMNLEEMLTNRGLAHAQAMTNADMIRQFREFGIKFEQGSDEVLNAALQREGVQLDQLGLTQVSHEALQGYYFDRSVAEIIDKVTSVASSDEALGKIGQFTAWWKGLATLSPGFHIRNDRTNRFILFMKNGTKSFQPKENFRAFVGAQYALHGEDGLRKLKIPEETIQRTLNEVVAGRPVREWATEARKSGVISRVTQGFDIPSMVKESADPKQWHQKLNPFKTENVLFEKSHELGAVVESAPKFQSMLMDLSEMAGDEVATESMAKYAMMEAKKWFFDYDDLAPFEKKVMKNIIPFYSWLRKNIALQISNMVGYKEMYAIVPKAQRAIQEEGMSVEDMPQWIRESSFIPVAESEEMLKGEEGMTRVFNPNLPYSDLNILPVRFEVNEMGIPIPKWEPQEIKDAFLGAANPVLKTVMAMSSKEGWDPFLKKDLDSQAPAPRAMRLIAAVPGVLQVLDAAARIIRPEDGLDFEYTDDGQLLIDGKIQFLLETNFLVLKRLEQMGDLPLMAFPELEKKLAEVTGVKDKYEGVARTLQTLSFWLGIKQKDIDLDQQESYRFREILKDAEKQRSKALRRAPGAQARRTDYQKRQQTQMARLGLR